MPDKLLNLLQADRTHHLPSVSINININVLSFSIKVVS